MDSIAKDQTVQYILTMLDDMLQVRVTPLTDSIQRNTCKLHAGILIVYRKTSLVWRYSRSMRARRSSRCGHPSSACSTATTLSSSARWRLTSDVITPVLKHVSKCWCRVWRCRRRASSPSWRVGAKSWWIDRISSSTWRGSKTSSKIL